MHQTTTNKNGNEKCVAHYWSVTNFSTISKRLSGARLAVACHCSPVNQARLTASLVPSSPAPQFSDAHQQTSNSARISLCDRRRANGTQYPATRLQGCILAPLGRRSCPVAHVLPLLLPLVRLLLLLLLSEASILVSCLNDPSSTTWQPTTLLGSGDGGVVDAWFFILQRCLTQTPKKS